MALVDLEGIIGSSRRGFDSDSKPMIVIVSSFWQKMTKEIQSTHAHGVFDVQNKMVPVDSREKQKLGILNDITRERRREMIEQCIINMLTA